jgi:hypothetical protein
MKRSILCFLLLLIFSSGLAHSKGKKDADVPAVFGAARYVYVEAVDGDEFNPRLLPEDRQAIADVRHALQDWNRYVLTIRRREADLVFVVRKGRLVTAEAGAGVHIGSRQGVNQGPAQYPADQDPNRDPNYGDPGRDPNYGDPGRDPNYGGANHGTRVGAGGGVGPPDDLLFVDMLNRESGHSTRIWMQSQKDGLDGPEVPLFKQIRDAVEKAYPTPPPPPRKTP